MVILIINVNMINIKLNIAPNLLNSSVCFWIKVQVT